MKDAWIKVHGCQVAVRNLFAEVKQRYLRNRGTQCNAETSNYLIGKEATPQRFIHPAALQTFCHKPTTVEPYDQRGTEVARQPFSRLRYGNGFFHRCHTLDDSLTPPSMIWFVLSS